MSGVAFRRRAADLALVAASARGVFHHLTFRGRVHRTDARWTLGSYPAERLAVRAVLDASRRR